jgi:hypothetical protein
MSLTQIINQYEKELKEFQQNISLEDKKENELFEKQLELKEAAFSLHTQVTERIQTLVLTLNQQYYPKRDSQSNPDEVLQNKINQISNILLDMQMDCEPNAQKIIKSIDRLLKTLFSIKCHDEKSQMPKILKPSLKQIKIEKLQKENIKIDIKPYFKKSIL